MRAGSSLQGQFEVQRRLFTTQAPAQQLGALPLQLQEPVLQHTLILQLPPQQPLLCVRFQGVDADITGLGGLLQVIGTCLLYTSPSPRDS